MKTVFLRVPEADDKAAALLDAVRKPALPGRGRRLEVDAKSFAAVPRSPFAYWVSDELRDLFKRLPSFEAEGRTVRQGLATADDFRFVRAWWAVPPGSLGGRWFPYLKGGTRSPFYSPVHLVTKCVDNFRENVAFTDARYPYLKGGSRSMMHSDESLYFGPGLTWALRTAKFSPACVPAGCIFSVSRYQAFCPERDLPATLALLNGSVCTTLLRMCLERFEHPKFIVGAVKLLPFPPLGDADTRALGALARRGVRAQLSLDACSEASHAFALPALLQGFGGATRGLARAHLEDCAAMWLARVASLSEELDAVQAEIDVRSYALYGIEETDRRAIAEGFGLGPPGTQPGEAADDSEDHEEDDVDSVPSGDVTDLAAGLVSWAVGVAFGRFDVRLATGARPLPDESGPFDPLPVCTPGMLTDANGLPLGESPEGYPIAFPDNGVLVDDPGDLLDLTTAVRAVFDTVFGTEADCWWGDIAILLNAKGKGLRAWLGAGFFEHHIRQYSKGRRKAPILWQLGTPSGRYSTWLYAHRLTPDSLFQVQNDAIGPKLAFEERALTRLVQTGDGNRSASERKEAARQAEFVEELRTMLSEIKRVAPLWNPNLDDGVVLTMAPLWRLVPQHKSWQKELEGKWHELSLGKYDWSHIAMHLWPERVVPQCAVDRSLAIAHGLEEAFWEEGSDGKWQPRREPSRLIDELIRERSSSAVQAAVASLIAASVAVGKRRPSRREGLA